MVEHRHGGLKTRLNIDTMKQRHSGVRTLWNIGT